MSFPKTAKLKTLPIFPTVQYLTVVHRISDFYACLLPQKISAFQGIGSRRSMPVEGLEGQVLSGVPFT